MCLEAIFSFFPLEAFTVAGGVKTPRSASSAPRDTLEDQQQQGPTIQDYQERLLAVENGASTFDFMHLLLVEDGLTVGEAYLFFHDYCQAYLTYKKDNDKKDTKTWKHFSKTHEHGLSKEEIQLKDDEYLQRILAFGLVGIAFPRMEYSTFKRNAYREKQYPAGKFPST